MACLTQVIGYYDPSKPLALSVSSKYLLSVDNNSKWIEIAELDDLTSSNIICYLKSQFVRCSIPDNLWAATMPPVSMKVQHSKILVGTTICAPNFKSSVSSDKC